MWFYAQNRNQLYRLHRSKLRLHKRESLHCLTSFRWEAYSEQSLDKCLLRPFPAIKLYYICVYTWASQVALWWRPCLLMQEMQETWVGSLGREDPLEEGMATHSSVLAWRIPWTEESGRLQSIGSHRVRHTWSDLAHTRIYTLCVCMCVCVCVCVCVAYGSPAVPRHRFLLVFYYG